MNKTEILAPAGSYASIYGAITAGADAVYVGGNKFGARAYADNPNESELLSAIDFVHLNGKKIYMTVNTLFKQKELEKELFDFLKVYYEHGIDAVIVQDLGVLSFVSKNFPGLPIHLSTQNSICTGAGADFLKKYACVTRVVPARELSLTEIKRFRSETGLEMECFVHGALCYSYSGQCLFSSMIGGRSGNRGRCAQPCRQKYTLSEESKKVRDGYLLSLKDMCTLDFLPDLIDAGINSFKIEGRMKRPEYSAGVTAAYSYIARLYENKGRDGFEKYIKENPNELPEKIKEVSELFNRGGFSKGYYFCYHGKNMMSDKRPNHSGILVGNLKNVYGRSAIINITEKINKGDILEIRNNDTFEFTVGAEGLKSYNESRDSVYEICIPANFKCKAGDMVYRTKNETLYDKINESYLVKHAKRSVSGHIVLYENEKIRLNVSSDNFSFTVTGDIAEKAKNVPMSAEDIKKVLNKTGESEFDFSYLTVDMGDNIFVPVGKLKELRRAAFLGLKNTILDSYKRKSEKCFEYENEAKSNDECGIKSIPEIVCRVSDKAELDAVLDTFTPDLIILDMQDISISAQIDYIKQIKEKNIKAVLCLPRILRYRDAERLDKEADFAIPDGFMVHSLDEIAFLKKHKECKNIICSEFLYVMNNEAGAFLKEITGAKTITASLELNLSELKELDFTELNMTIYGRVPLMVTAGCVRDNFLNCSKNLKGTVKEISITDKTGAVFPVKTCCTTCVNIIYNSEIYSIIGLKEEQELSYAKSHMLSFTTESYAETKEIIKAYLNHTEPTGKFTRGHIRRGVE